MIELIRIEHKTCFDEFDICCTQTSAFEETTIFYCGHSTLQQTDSVTLAVFTVCLYAR